MRIALIPSSFHPHLGGVEELVRQLAHHLIQAGHHPGVFTNRWPKNLPSHELVEGLSVHRHVFRVPASPGKITWAASALGPIALTGLCNDLRRFRADLIHVQCVSSNAYYAMKAKRRLGLPLVVTLQGELTMDAEGIFQKQEFAQQMLRNVLESADVISACSGQTLADAERFYGSSLGDRAHVIFNGAEAGDFENAEPFQGERPYFFAMGRLVPQKGFDVLIKAFAQANIQTHDLLIAGDGSERESLEKLCGSLNVSGAVRLVGRADRASVASLLRGASFFVLPSRADEGLPVVCAEAMAAGKAIIATRSGGAPEAVIHEETGLIVEKESVVELASAIRRLIDRPADCSRFASMARERSKLFLWPNITKQYVAVYQRLMVVRETGHVFV